MSENWHATTTSRVLVEGTQRIRSVPLVKRLLEDLHGRYWYNDHRHHVDIKLLMHSFLLLLLRKSDRA